MSWQDHALCRDLPASAFTTDIATNPNAGRAVEQLCRFQCPVRLQCAQTALAKAESGQEYTGAYIAGAWHVPANQATDTTRWRTMRTLLAIIRAYSPKEAS